MAKAKSITPIAAILLLVGFAVYTLISADMSKPDPRSPAAKTLLNDSSGVPYEQLRFHELRSETRAIEKPMPVPELAEKRITGPSPELAARPEVREEQVVPDRSMIIPTPMPREEEIDKLNKRWINNRTLQIVEYFGPKCGLCKNEKRDVINLLKERNERIYYLRGFIYDKKEFIKEANVVIENCNNELRYLLSEDTYRKFNQLFSARDVIKRFFPQ